MGCLQTETIRQGRAIMHVPCGKCNYCLSSNRADWTFRIHEQLKVSNSAMFLTMTYDDVNQPLADTVPTLVKRDCQLFLKRLRKANDSEPNPENGYKRYQPQPIKYYMVGEYGPDTFRPHYHAIMFNVKPETTSKIESIWGLGFTVIGNVEPASIHYVTKYVLNKHDKWAVQYGVSPAFSLISQGMGASYLETNGHEHKKALQTFVINDRGKQRLPRYYKDKIFTYQEKDVIRRTSIQQADVLRKKAVHEAKAYSETPENYLDEVRIHTHDKITNKNVNPNPEQL